MQKGVKNAKLISSFLKTETFGSTKARSMSINQIKKELAVTDLPEKGRETPPSFVSFTFVFDHLKIPLSTNLLELDF